MRPIITLTTDFGTGSPYVAQLKGTILSLVRDVDLIDVSHAVGPQNVREGAVVLADATPRFPPGTIHVAVVDPGVGAARRLVYCEIGPQRYLAPDNGLLSLLATRQPPQRMVALESPRYWLPQPSRTFHGRDILAPAAAHLAGGVEPAELGPPVDALVTLDWPRPRITPDTIAGEILYIDSFGNLITNIGRECITPFGDPASLIVECGGRQITGLAPTYGASPASTFIALIDSQDRLEIALVQGSAARELRSKPADPVVLKRGR